jgi:hypothetical protein
MAIFKNRLSSEYKILPLGTVVLTAGPDTVKVIDLEDLGPIRSIVAVLADIDFAGAGNTLTWYGTPNADGSGAVTKIAQITLAAAATDATLQIDAEDISEAAEVAGLQPEGFKSLSLRIDASNEDEVNATIVIDPLHKYDGLTPTSSSVLT